MTAPDLSPAEAEIVARFDAAPTLPEAYQPSPVDTPEPPAETQQDEACPFCQIISGAAPGKIIYRWDDAIALVPLNPVTPGHVLIVPLVHVANAVRDPWVTAATYKRAAQLAAESTDPGVNLITSVGEAATQTVEHLHVHLVPRRDGDGLALPWTAALAARPSADTETLRARIGDLLIDHMPTETARGYVCDCNDQGSQNWREHVAGLIAALDAR